jgi:serine protease AprX
MSVDNIHRFGVAAMSVRRSVALVAAAATLGALTLSGGTVAVASTGSPSASPVTVAGGVSGGRLVIRVAQGFDVVAVADGVRAAGARVIGVQKAVGTLVADVPPAALAAVRVVPGVAVITADYEVKSQSLGFDSSTQPGSMTNVTRVSGATGMWQKGWTGNGIDVALIDTGVAPVPGLMDSAKIVVGPDLSFESQDADLRYLDTFGHGTHMAGIIAGREVSKGTGASYAADTTDFLGMAPDARLVSLKLADHNGVVDVSQMIAAIDWVVQYRLSNGLNIRVLNLSYGTWAMNDPQSDPLSWAAEVAWAKGIVVVASAGNEGDTKGGITAPAYNPWVIAVGAADTKGTLSTADDTVASFSARQGGSFPDRGIDLVASGVGIVSTGVPGSYIYQNYPSAHVGNGFIRGSGTSQAAAVVSGAAALMLSQRPALLPDQVKALLMDGATDLASDPVTKQGSGELNLATSSALAVPSLTQSPPVGNGTGRLESTRNKTHVVMNGTKLTGAVDIFGNAFDTTAMAAAAGSTTAWGADGSFNGVIWTGKTWTGKTWTGDSWSGKTWTNAAWTGSGWSAASWTAPVSNDAWAGAGWTTDFWG